MYRVLDERFDSPTEPFEGRVRRDVESIAELSQRTRPRNVEVTGLDGCRTQERNEVRSETASDHVAADRHAVLSVAPGVEFPCRSFGLVAV